MNLNTILLLLYDLLLTPTAVFFVSLTELLSGTRRSAQTRSEPQQKTHATPYLYHIMPGYHNHCPLHTAGEKYLLLRYCCCYTGGFALFLISRGLLLPPSAPPPVSNRVHSMCVISRRLLQLPQQQSINGGWLLSLLLPRPWQASF